MKQLRTFIQMKIDEGDWIHFLIGADWADENGFPYAAEWLRWMHERQSSPRLDPSFPITEHSRLYWETFGEADSERHRWVPLPLEIDPSFREQGFSVDYPDEVSSFFAVLECAESTRTMPGMEND